MLLTEKITLPCGLQFPNRLCKVRYPPVLEKSVFLANAQDREKKLDESRIYSNCIQAAMAEVMASTHDPDQKLATAYTEWADGGWGLVITGNVQVSELHHGSPNDVEVPSRNSASDLAADARAKLWKTWAETCQRSGTPTIVQLVHPGRQSPRGAGRRGLFSPSVAPSVVKMSFGDTLVSKLAVTLAFGTPRELTVDEIQGNDGIIEQFVAGGKQAFDAGFKGIELHAAHGYLLAQFLSPKTNSRTDEFGGTPAKRAEIVLRIIRRIREQTSKEFCIGIKLNSVDAASSESLPDVLAQIQLIVDTGVDFIEISGGTYENPRMMEVRDAMHVATPSSSTASPIKESTLKRESFFLQFAQQVRERFPNVVLMVTGGFRTRIGMEAALESGACDLIGIARPAAVVPKLPKEIILNVEGVSDEDANVALAPLQLPLWARLLPLKPIASGYQSQYYASQIRRIGDCLQPVDNRLRIQVQE